MILVMIATEHLTPADTMALRDSLVWPLAERLIELRRNVAEAREQLAALPGGKGTMRITAIDMKLNEALAMFEGFRS